MCHFICNHSYFGNIVLVCIMVSSAMLAAEDPLKSDSPRNKVSKFLVHFRTFQDCRKVLKFWGYTWLIHTSVLPSNWNLGKIFALTGQLGQEHMVKKIFPIFLHAGRWLFLLLNLLFSSKLVSKMNWKKMTPALRNFKNISFTICTWQ